MLLQLVQLESVKMIEFFKEEMQFVLLMYKSDYWTLRFYLKFLNEPLYHIDIVMQFII